MLEFFPAFCTRSIQMASVRTPSRSRSRKSSRKPELIGKPRGVIHPRVQAVGPERFGIVSVVCFTIGITGQAELLGSEGVHDARFETGFLKSAEDKFVIATGAFDGDDQIAQVVLADGV